MHEHEDGKLTLYLMLTWAVELCRIRESWDVARCGRWARAPPAIASAPPAAPVETPPEPAPVEHEAPAVPPALDSSSPIGTSPPKDPPGAYPCPVEGCSAEAMNSEAALDRHLELSHADEQPPPAPIDRKLKPGQAMVLGEIAYCVRLDAFAPAIGRGQTLEGNGTGGGLANGRPKTARAVLEMLRDNGFLSPDPDKPGSFTRLANGPDGRRRYVCVRTGCSAGRYWPGQGPDNDTELRLLVRVLAKDLARERTAVMAPPTCPTATKSRNGSWSARDARRDPDRCPASSRSCGVPTAAHCAQGALRTGGPRARVCARARGCGLGQAPLAPDRPRAPVGAPGLSEVAAEATTSSPL